jgi:hypothetical protein
MWSALLRLRDVAVRVSLIRALSRKGPVYVF